MAVMKQSEWEYLVKKEFSYLFDEWGFKIASDKYYPDVFGDRVTVLQSSEYVVTLVIEKSIFLVKLGPKEHSEQEKDLILLISFLRDDPAFAKQNIPDIFSDLSIEGRVQLYSSFFEQHQHELFDLLKEEQQNDFLEDLGKFRKKLRKLRRERKPGK